MRLSLFATVCSVALMAQAVTPRAAEFVYDEKTNQELAKQLDVRLNCAVGNVTDQKSHVEVTGSIDGKETTERFDACIITTPTQPALAMFPQMNPVQAEFYRNTTYISAVDTHLALRNRPTNPATYIMVSPREKRITSVSRASRPWLSYCSNEY